MFSRHQRVSRGDFPHALAHGKRLSTDYFTAILPDEPLGYAVVIPKKVARLSVTRHRLKRRILIFLQQYPFLPPSLILFPRVSAVTLPAQDLSRALFELLARVRTREQTRLK